VVIITTRGGEADRYRGAAAGADRFIAKGDRLRQELLDAVEQLLR
jgi:two-component system sensor histidine kinase and response regulator WspE